MHLREYLRNQYNHGHLRFLKLIANKLTKEEEVPKERPRPRLVVYDPVENRLNAMAPYLAAAVVAWPMYWIYRGFEWHNHRDSIALKEYIRKTYYHAKIIKVGILITAVIATLNMPTPKFHRPERYE